MSIIYQGIAMSSVQVYVPGAWFIGTTTLILGVSAYSYSGPVAMVCLLIMSKIPDNAAKLAQLAVKLVVRSGEAVTQFRSAKAAHVGHIHAAHDDIVYDNGHTKSHVSVIVNAQAGSHLVSEHFREFGVYVHDKVTAENEAVACHRLRFQYHHVHVIAHFRISNGTFEPLFQAALTFVESLYWNQSIITTKLSNNITIVHIFIKNLFFIFKRYNIKV